MSMNQINRRDALKLIGSMGVAALASGFVKPSSFRFSHKTLNSKPNIIVILFDSLSARHMSLFGYGRKTTPNIDNFAKRSTVFHHHYSASNFTQSSTASTLTGVHPWSHRSLDFFEPLVDRYETQNVFSWLAPAYRNIAYTHNQHAFDVLAQLRRGIDELKPIEDLVLQRTYRLDNQFSRDRNVGGYASKTWLEEFFSPSLSLFLSPLFHTIADALANKVDRDNKALYPLGVSELEGCLFRVEDAIDWIIEVSQTNQSPFLGYFHLLPPHEDYKPRVEFLDMYVGDQLQLVSKPEHFFSQHMSRQFLEFQCQLYDDYVTHVDSEFGRLVENLKKQGRLDDSYVIVTSDHGQLFERGIHGHTEPVLYESVVHVPLIIHHPGQQENANIFSPTSSVDLAPTLVQISGMEKQPGLEGQVLPSLGGVEIPQRTIFSMHARHNVRTKRLTTVTFAAIQWPYKLILYRGYQGLEDYAELFDLENDPEELTNLASQLPATVQALQGELLRKQMLAESSALNLPEPAYGIPLID